MRLSRIPDSRLCIYPIVWFSLITNHQAVLAQLVTPEPTHAASLVVGGALGDDFAPLRLVMGLEWAGERGLQLWKVMPPPGVITGTVVPTALGQISNEADGGLWRLLGLLHLGHGYGAYEFFNGSMVPHLVDILIDQARDRRPIEDAESASYLYMMSMAGRTDLEAFEKHKGKIAACLVEPVAANMGVVPPIAGFLQQLRSLCDDEKAVLIFDEVITGFRVAFGGAQECNAHQVFAQDRIARDHLLRDGEPPDPPSSGRLDVDIDERCIRLLAHRRCARQRGVSARRCGFALGKICRGRDESRG